MAAWLIELLFTRGEILWPAIALLLFSVYLLGRHHGSPVLGHAGVRPPTPVTAPAEQLDADQRALAEMPALFLSPATGSIDISSIAAFTQAPGLELVALGGDTIHQRTYQELQEEIQGLRDELERVTAERDNKERLRARWWRLLGVERARVRHAFTRLMTQPRRPSKLALVEDVIQVRDTVVHVLPSPILREWRHDLEAAA